VTAQPTPAIEPEDVERVARREFPVDAARILELLGEYGAKDWHREIDRVRLAVLKLAAGSIDRLRTALETANADYRDVLAAAEYPEYSRSIDPSQPVSVKQRERIIAADWKQYCEWLDG
jgi:hypothetical protein